jgi:hypothetical protein
MSLITAHKDTRSHFPGSALEKAMLQGRGAEAQENQLLQTEKDRDSLQEFRCKKIEVVRAQKEEALRLQKAEQERQQKESEEYLRREEAERKWLASESKIPVKPVSHARTKPSLWQRVATIARNIISYLIKCFNYYRDKVVTTCSRIRTWRVGSSQWSPGLTRTG